MFIRSLGSLGGEVRSAFQILHITGAGDSDWAAKEYSRSGVAYRTWAFLDSIEDAYSAANIAVTRSGSSAIFELALFGKPMILVPYPFAMSHQTENARVFSAAGAAIEMQERDLSPEAFAREMSRLAGDRGRLETMEKAARNLSVPRASDNLADEVLMLAGRRPRVSG
jgi:UDP-N-acetylglucosamine--N-acetylmuramyl-(pentapeptide) pyrophosphoryl-undecaprenol N-acetylglucosamine transferase